MALDDTIAMLAQAPLFSHFERDALRLIAFSADPRRLRANEILFRQGERSDGGYVVIDGEIALARDDVDSVTLAGPGALIGQVALFLRTARPSSAVARERSTVIRVSPTLMRRVLDEFPSAAAELRDAMAEDLHDLTGKLDKVRRMLTAIDGG